MGPSLFFQLNPSQKINSTIYHNQVLLGLLKIFWEESKNEISESIVMEDSVPMHKGVCEKPRKDMKWATYSHPPNSPDVM